MSRSEKSTIDVPRPESHFSLSSCRIDAQVGLGDRLWASAWVGPPSQKHSLEAEVMLFSSAATEKKLVIPYYSAPQSVTITNLEQRRIHCLKEWFASQETRFLSGTMEDEQTS